MFIQKDISKKFLEIVDNLINSGRAKDDADIVEKINWDKTSMSSARKPRINVPAKYIENLEKVYNVKVGLESPSDEVAKKLIEYFERILYLEKRVRELEDENRVLKNDNPSKNLGKAK